MAKVDLSKYGITGTTEVVYNPSYEQLFEEETKPSLEGYEVGKSQPSYDKQFVRDWLKANPDSDYKLPQDVIDKTIAKYKEAYTLLTGKEL